MEVGYLGLGSNVGERREYLQAAVEELFAAQDPGEVLLAMTTGPVVQGA